jgi:hypothetical protein
MTHAEQTSAFAARVERLGLATTLEMEFRNEKELANYRKYLYGINKDGIRRYRTMREGQNLIVWRLK